MDQKLLTVSEAAKFKGVSTTTIYRAVSQGRLPHVRVLNHIGVPEAVLLKWMPVRYAGRAGAKGRGGRPKGVPLSEDAKERISRSQARRWQRRKAQESEAA
jgi:excisionase family DNA binding protein